MEPGEQIGDYIIIRQIGEGGMSVVYLAEHKEHRTQAVVKHLRQQLALSEQLVKYFVQGARIMHELRHPHLAAVFDYVEDGDRYFMVEEYLSGGSLADLLDKGEPISEAEALRWCRDALRAVDYAHQSGIVHRDLKPGNLMLNQKREVKVTDFGIARVFGGPRLTKTGDEKGTPLYMSPEQIRTPDKVDHLTDVYSMGVVLYELLTRRLPFDGESEFDVKQAVVLNPPAPPRQLNRSISREVDRIVMKAMEKRPENRFSGCGEFALHIDRHLSSSGSSSLRNVLDRIKQHGRVAAGLIVLLLAALLAPRVIDFVRRQPDGGGVGPPVVELLANPQKIPSGQAVTIEWKAQKADKVRIEPDLGDVPVNGSRTIYPTKSASYVITATGANGTMSTKTVDIAVVALPVIEIAASHAVITPGHPTVLTWKAYDADSVRIEPGIGDVPTSGSRIVTPRRSVTYVATAKGPGGTASQKVDLVVGAETTTVPRLPGITLSATPGMVVSGQPAVLEWDARDAQSVRIDPDVGPVGLNGRVKVTPAKSVEYTATATGPAGTQTAKVRVVVEAPPAATPTLVLSVKPSVIQAGQSAVLEWEAQNAHNVRIEPEIGVVPLTGRVKVAPAKSVTFSATATGPAGTRSATAQITVEPGAPLAPSVTLRAQPEVIEAGQQTVIEWTSQHAGNVRIDPGIGAVPATGTLSVTPTQSVTLHATATGPGGKATARVDITVQPRPPSLKGPGGNPSEKRRSGTIIWTGQVGKNEVITIDGGSATIGVVQGTPLPGVPCRIQLSDSSVAVVEPPGSGNSYRKIVLRFNRSGNFSVRINWEALN